MLPTQRDDGIACDNCPFWGDERIEAVVRRRPERITVMLSTCRQDRPGRAVGEVDFEQRSTAMGGVAVVYGHGWTPAKYWCGRHPAFNHFRGDPPGGVVAQSPHAVKAVRGPPVSEPDPETNKE